VADHHDMNGLPRLAALRGGQVPAPAEAAPPGTLHAEAADSYYHTLLSNLPDTVVSLYDRELRCVSIDGHALSANGTDRDAFIGKTLRATLGDDDADLLEAHYISALDGTPGALDFPPSGSDQVFRLEIVPFRTAPDQPITGVFTVARNVTSQRRGADESAKRARQQAAVAELGVTALEGMQPTELMDRAVSMVSEILGVEFCEVLELSEGRESMLLRSGSGWAEGLVRTALVPAGSEWHAGFTWGSRGPVIVRDYKRERRFKPTRILCQHEVASGISVVIGARNRAFGVLGAHSATVRNFETYEADFVHAVANVLAQAYAHEQAENRIRHQALHDPLTGLPNRTLILERLQHWFERARRTKAQGALLFIDLDEFKLVNDRLGHDAGDRLLCAVGERLGGVVRASDTVSRVGGDEFLVLCEDLSGGREAVELAERLLACLEDPFSLSGRRHRVTASIGLALSQGQGSADALIRDADAAMYRAKERGGGRCDVFDEAMRDWSLRWREAEADLRRGLDAGEFFNLYQPIVSAADGAILGFEALVRWRHPRDGIVSPVDFIPTAEQSGLIVELGEWVLRRACADAVDWVVPNAKTPGLRVSVNVSPRQLTDPGLVATVAAALQASGLAADRLSLELTESALIEDAESTLQILSDLKALGVRLELDDFGTGYSSLTYARRFPIDALKIDRSFVDGLGTSPEDSAIVSAVISMGRALGLHVVAEGVETEEQVRQLRLMGCRLAQGYLFSRPVVAADALELIGDLSRIGDDAGLAAAPRRAVS
jgi:diguanylate cyclase (GGDEF)-like protein